jgi:hypothetical protein
MLTAATILEKQMALNFKNYQVSYAGLMLLNESLAPVLGKQKNIKGNSHIRRVLFMPAFVAKHNENQQ